MCDKEVQGIKRQEKILSDLSKIELNPEELKIIFT